MIRWSVCALLLLSIGLSELRATHIVGGELNYTCLGNDQYRLELTIFRDCFNGNPNAFFDNPAAIGLFDANNELVDNFEIPFDFNLNDTLQPVLSNPCLVVPPNVCVHTTTYTQTVTIPYLPGGYTLAYQRCCRNQTINNIIDPLDSGATYSANISEAALLACNSNPQFNDWPPLYICVNEPIDFDQSAVDADGDSLVYRLCTPQLGGAPSATGGSPQPNPPNPPPYELVNWVPGFDENNMLNGGGGNDLTIDPNTGFLTGVPTIIGQFVVGICVEEYRNGQLISTTRRDFQYNVGDCDLAVSSFFAPGIQCDDNNVSFSNQSSGSSIFEWNFGDPANPGVNSTLAEPTYTYPDTGTYLVQLIVNAGFPCVDTAYRTVRIQETTIAADFDVTYTECSDSIYVAISDTSVDTVFVPVAWQWTSSDGQSSALQNPTFAFAGTDPIFLTLTVTSSNGCTRTLAQAIDAGQVIAPQFDQTALSACNGETLALNPTATGNYTYQWSPADALSDPSAANPTVVVDMSYDFSVTVTDPVTGCTLEETISVAVFNPNLLPPDTLRPCFGESVALFPGATANYAYAWSPAALLDDPALPNPSYLATADANFTGIVTASDGGGTCSDTVQVSVRVGGAGQFAAMPDTVLCAPTVLVTVDAPGFDDLTWSQLADFSEITAFGSSFLSAVSGSTTYYVRGESPDGCERIDSVNVALLGVGLSLPDTSFCRGDTLRFSAPQIASATYQWTPENLILQGQGTNTVLLVPAATGTLTVTVDNGTACTAAATAQLTLLGERPSLFVSADPIDLFRGQTTQLLAESDPGTTYRWTPAATLDDPERPDPTAAPTTDTYYEVTVTNDAGCVTRGGIQIRLNPPTCDAPLIFIPSGFTPNGDGRNDAWQVYGTPIDELHVWVYNRWGELVWETTDPGAAWDGSFKGKALPSDAFGYYVEARCFDGEVFTQKGNVTLVR